MDFKRTADGLGPLLKTFKRTNVSETLFIESRSTRDTDIGLEGHQLDQSRSITTTAEDESSRMGKERKQQEKKKSLNLDLRTRKRVSRTRKSNKGHKLD